jgi:hypothetical protein
VVPIAYAIQAAAQAPVPAPSGPEVTPSDFRLKAPAPGMNVLPHCENPAPGEILVCGRRGQGQRVTELRLPPGVKPKQRVGFDLGGGRVQPAMHEQGMPQGRVSKRFTIDFLFPF